MAATRTRKKSPVDALTQAAALEGAKEAAFASFLKAQDRESPGKVRRLDDERVLDIRCIPTGAISLDVAIGAGGFPRGRITELYGPEGGGKTTLALSSARICQDAGGIVGFVDAEHGLNPDLVRNLGIDPARFAIAVPDSGEEAIEEVTDMVMSGAFDMVIVDSVAAMVPLAEIEGEVTQQHMGLHARLMSRFMRKVNGPVAEKDVALVLLNQVRQDLTSYGAPEKSTGGRGIKFYASLRIEVRSGSKASRIEDKVTKTVAGQTVTCTVTKNRLGPPWRKAEYDLIFGRGIEAGGSLLDVALSLGVITKDGHSYFEEATGQRIGVYADPVKAALTNPPADDPHLTERITASVYASLQADRVPVTAPGEDVPGSDGEIERIDDVA